MTHRKLWDRHELRWILIYQTISAIGAAWAVLLQYYAFTDDASTWWILRQSKVFAEVAAYLLLLIAEGTTLLAIEPPPWCLTLLHGLRLVIASVGLCDSILVFRLDLEPFYELNFFLRAFVSPTQELVVFILWWLASYNGTVHVVSIWLLSRQNAGHAETFSQFDFSTTIGLLNVHIARWTVTGIDGQKRGLLGRTLVYASLVPRIIFGSLGVFLSFSGRNRLRGEPRVKILGWRGIHDVRPSFDKDPELADYPRVRAAGQDLRDENHIVGLEQTDGPSGVPLPSLALTALPLQDNSGHEHVSSSSAATLISASQQNESIASIRRLRPRYLCILDDSQERGYRLAPTANDPSLDSMQYIFLSYTRIHFCTSIQGDPSATPEIMEQTRDLALADTARLTSFAIHAATQVGCRAFWIDFECLRPDNSEDQDTSRNIGDVYQICDIVRGSYCIAIAAGPPMDSALSHQATDYSQAARRSWLHGYGSRLWTLPEALLCPSNHGILLYTVTSEGFDCERIEKRNLAERIWTDAPSTRNLIEHYEGSLNLSQIDFISLALQCLQRRKTVTRMPADFIYALMGLLRERVAVKEKQSTFEAFAYLSLANDSQKLLERLFCMRSDDESTQWHDMSDFWDANIRDIVPGCEVTEVTGGDTVRIARMQGATIQWAPLPGLRFELARPKRLSFFWSWQRSEIANMLLLLATMLIAALFHLHVYKNILKTPEFRSKAAYARVWLNFFISLLIIPAMISLFTTCIFLPSSLYRIYGGEVKNVQARFFGLSGVADLGSVEETLFGRNCGRFSWSTLNRQVATDYDETSTFTLIDTWLMTANVFHAATRPSIVAIPGKHRGALRAMLCSYDESTGVYHREKVLRMDERVLQRMPTIDPARFSLMPMEKYRDE